MLRQIELTEEKIDLLKDRINNVQRHLDAATAAGDKEAQVRMIDHILISCGIIRIFGGQELVNEITEEARYFFDNPIKNEQRTDNQTNESGTAS